MTRCSRLASAASLVALMTAPALALAAPVVVFDSWSGQNSSSNRGAGSAPGSLVTVSNSNHTISNISVRVDLNSSGNIKFVVFTHPATRSCT